MVFRISLFKLRIVLAIAVLFAVIASNRVVFGRIADGQRNASLGYTAAVPIVSTTLLYGEARDVFQKINTQRKLRKLKPLLWNEKLSELAAAYSRQMADDDFFGHFDLDGNSVVDRAEDFEVKDWLKLGENLFLCEGYANISETAVKGWMKSPTHRDNILDNEWTHTGVGVYKTFDDRTYITQVFMEK